MIKIKIEIHDQEVNALFARLVQRSANLRPLMQDIGDHLIETTKQRFDTSTGPDGRRWAPNRPSTLLRLLGRFQKSFGKDGRLTKGGAGRVMSKKPLVGETRSLSTTIHHRVGDNFVNIGSAMPYAAVQQFGATARSFTGGKTPWGDIPARPFLGLSTEDEAFLVTKAREYLDRAIGGA